MKLVLLGVAAAVGLLAMVLAIALYEGLRGWRRPRRHGRRG